MTRYCSALGLAVLLLAGCSSDPTRPYPVHGKVVLENGQPAADLAGGLVTFSSSEMQTSSTGEIGPDGTFELSTRKKGDGALPGTYEVSVSPSEPEERGERRTTRAHRPPQYVCDQPRVTVQPKTNEVKLAVRKVMPGQRE
jgi:hypothetical protein